MKSSIVIACHNGHPITVQTTGTQKIGAVSCPECGGSIYVVDPLGNYVARRILERAWAELKKGDSTLAILLCAVAVECELTGLFFKWKRVDVMDTTMPTSTDEGVWEEEWRKKNVSARLNTVSTLLTKKTFDDLVLDDPTLSQGFDYASKGYQSLLAIRFIGGEVWMDSLRYLSVQGFQLCGREELLHLGCLAMNSRFRFLGLRASLRSSRSGFLSP